MSITIKDLARLADVSHTTVSRALNDSAQINPNTKKKILALAKKHNYTPNYNAKSLVLNKSYNIGCFFTALKIGTSSSFLHEILLNIHKVINNKYSITINGIDEVSSFNTINSNRYDGIIIVSQSSSDDFFINHIVESNIPLVVLNRAVDFRNISWVISDDRAGISQAMSFLIENNHKKIALITGKQDFYSSNIRKASYEDALSKNNIPIDLRLIESGDYNIEGGYHAMNIILDRDTPSAVFACSDDMAIGAIKAIHDKGLGIPEDISIIGMDDSFYSNYTSPALTTVKRPIGKIAYIGATKLIDLIDNKGNEVNQVTTSCINTEFIIRDSVQYLNC